MKKTNAFHKQSANGSVSAEILLIEDETLLVQSLVKRLEDVHYAVDVAMNADKGLRLALRHDYDIIILDLLLPGKRDGMQLLREFRKHKSKSMVVVMSGKTMVEDKVEALRAGADDYLAKPFAFLELQARIETLLRRRGLLTTNTLEFKDIVMDLDTHRVTKEGKELKFSSKVFDLLAYLIRNKNRVVTRGELAEHVWGYKFEPESNLIDVYISYLRKELNKGTSESILQTVRKLGFMLSDK
jgi:DNA-binding response OmpR family regulator